MAKSLLITGGAKRVGRHLALHFAEAGYDIALHYHTSKADAQDVQKQIQALGRACELFHCDLGDAAATNALIAQVYAKMPGCGALINNASIFERADIFDKPLEMYGRHMDINLRAPVMLTIRFAELFKKGVVINLIDSHINRYSNIYFMYLLSKKSLADFTLMAAKVLGPHVRVHGICPGILMPSNEFDVEYMKKLSQENPLRETMPVEGIYRIAQWLIDEPDLTGQLIFADGGQQFA